MLKRCSMEGVSVLNDTPTTTKASNTSNDSSSLDDINYLLYLETLKRFKEEEANLSRRVEEKARQYEEVKVIYRDYYELYVQLYQAAVTRAVLENSQNFPEDQLSQAISDVVTIEGKVSNEKVVSYFKPEVLEKCRDIVRNISNYDEANDIQTEMAEQKATVKIIKTLNEAIPVALETATTQSLDYYVELVQNNQLDNSPIQNESHNEMDSQIVQHN